MVSKYEKYVGAKINQVVITKCFPVKKQFKRLNTRYRFVYDCNCGSKNNECDAATFIRSNTQSCGCIRLLKKQSNSVRWTGYEEISGGWLANLRGKAKFRNREFNVTIEYLWDLFLKQNKKCKLTGENLTFNIHKNGGNNQWTASLDRINSSKGYVEGNVQFLHVDANYIKRHYTDQEIINWSILINNKNVILNSVYNIPKTRQWMGYKNLPHKYITKSINRCKHDSNLTLEQAWSVFEKQNCQCAISGLLLEFKHLNIVKQTASLDRIDSAKGYTTDNVQWVHRDINWMKQDYDQDVFLDWMNKIYLHNLEKK